MQENIRAETKSLPESQNKKHLYSAENEAYTMVSAPLSANMHFLNNGIAEQQAFQPFINAHFPTGLTVLDLFRQQVERTPENIAVTFQDRQLSYQELDAESSRLAHHILQFCPIQHDDLIGVELERAEWMIIAILAIMKTGAAYVPIDPDAPVARKEFQKSDGNFKSYINQEYIDQYLQSQSSYPSTPPPISLDPSNLIYVIYTSGTTGQPKGVKIEHRHVVRLLFNDIRLFDFNNTDVWTLFHNYYFDFSVWEMYGALLYGGRLVIVPKETAKDTALFLDLLTEQRVTVLNQTPSAFYNLAEVCFHRKQPTDLKIRYIIFGGEALQPARLQWWHQTYPSTQLINMYGITETTVHVTYKQITQKEIIAGKSNIGKPIPTLSCYIMNEQGNPCPIGEPGELYVGGIGVARGYLNRPELTEQKFITHPLVQNERLYKSGDLARWLPNGDLEYLGRIDHQVKIRGHRIELGEIESVLASHPEINQTTVQAIEMQGTEKELIAYYTGKAIPHELRNFLRAKLPDYMVPGYYVPMEILPLTSNGKIDRKALPLPESTGLIRAAYVAPVGTLENELTNIWSNVLAISANTLGTATPFADLGGNSIKAIRIIGQIHQQLGVQLSLKEWFANPTIQQCAKLIASKQKSRYAPIPQRHANTPIPLSASQLQIWLLSQSENGNLAYNNPWHYQISGQLNLHAFQQAFSGVMKRHEVLRTIFFTDQEGQPFQHILPADHPGFQIQYLNLSTYAFEEQQLHINKTFDALNQTFLLDKEPLIRCAILKISPTQYHWILVIHHIIQDGWSMGIFIQELQVLYAAAIQRKPDNLPQRHIQYKDYAEWQKQQRLTLQFQQQKEYWLNQFKDPVLPLELSIGKPRPKIKAFQGNVIHTQLTKELSHQLQQFAQQHNGTLFMTLLTAVHVLLQYYTKQDDIVLGSTIHGRNQPDTQMLQGAFINPLPIRNISSPEQTLTQLFHQVKQNTLDAFANSDYPFDQLVNELQLPKDPSRNPLFDVLIVLQNAAENIREFTLGETIIKQLVNVSRHTAKFDLFFEFTELPEGISLSLEYDTNLYHQEFASQITNHLITVLQILTQKPQTPIQELQLLSTQEQQFHLNHLNPTPTTYPKNKNFLSSFQQQVQQQPQHIAIAFHEQQLSYQQLDQLSNQIANRLIQQYHPQPDQLIAIQLERSPWMIATILGILKTGAAYLPIDTNNPDKRTQFILQDSKAIGLINDEWIQQFQKKHDQLSTQQPNITILPQHLCNCLYTSGSTGKPKGVLLTHTNLTCFLYAAQQSFCKEISGIPFLASTNYVFDISILEILGALSFGNTLELIDAFDFNQIKNAIAKNKQIIVQTTPSLLRELMEAHPDLPTENIHSLIVGGEVLDLTLFTNIKKTFPNALSFNAYGPTECTIWATTSPLHLSDSVSIGKPLPNYHICILRNHQMTPLGISGEICIGGDAVAQGYLNQPELTEEKFISHPYIPELRLYRTGDLGRWLPNGDIEYIGRIDNQVKINGLRIEPGEIEQVLQRHEKIREVKVLPIQIAGAWHLTAYHTGSAPDAELLAMASAQLPSYMVPQFVVHLDAFPLTPTGKLNKKALPLPEKKDMTTHTYIRPFTPIERQLTSIWAKVLNKSDEEIGIDDDFFEMGGTSMKAIQMMGLVNQQINSKLLFKNIWTARTIRTFAKRLATETQSHIIRFSTSVDQRHIFFIPPVSGIPNGLEIFFNKLKGYNGWGFIYTRDIDFIEYCIENIMELTKDATHVSLIGHSIGGNICHAITVELEKRGRKVDRMILLDAYPLDSLIAERKRANDLKIIELSVRRENRTLNRLIRKNLLLSEVVTHYTRYGFSKITEGKINADIILIRTIVGLLHPKLFDWSNQTNGRYAIFKGFGQHDNMMGHPHIQKNTKLLLNIYTDYQASLRKEKSQDRLLRLTHAFIHKQSITVLRKKVSILKRTMASLLTM